MKVKLVISILLLCLAFLFVYQNTDLVSIDFLVWSVDLSLSLLVLFVFAGGLTIGWLLSSYLRFTRNRKKTKEEASQQAELIKTNTEAVRPNTGETKSDAQ
jgi:uncharacterized integral membrane protein